VTASHPTKVLRPGYVNVVEAGHRFNDQQSTH
jgi:hypothetical protein